LRLALCVKWKTLLLTFHTLRHLRPRQIVHRLLFEVRFSLYRRYPLLSGKGLPAESAVQHPPLTDAVFLKGLREASPWPGLEDQEEVLARSGRLLRNEFVFLNHPHCFEGEIDWRCPSVSHLWRYQLHYFNYAWDLGVAYLTSGEEKYYLKFRGLAESWIGGNPLGQLDGWHPYTISLRVVNWIYACELFGSAIAEDEPFWEKFLQSLYRQCDFLFHNIEYQGYGNHLLANVKALIFGGVLFEGAAPKRWLGAGLRLLRQELDEQVLGDGGHFERSPMYHLIVMKDLIECLIILQNNGYSVPPRLKQKIEDMARFAGAILTPEGRIPLLNDSAHDLTPEPMELIGIARYLCKNERLLEHRSFSYLLLDASKEGSPPSLRGDGFGSIAFKDTGYFVMRGPQGSGLILDCGPVCPDYLPPHAHADTLSYELWVGGAGVITDSGVYEYTAGVWRDFFRSTRAHNTVVIDGEDQSEVWGSFRVARRAYPQDVVWISTEEGDYFSGGHDGYRRLQNPVLHHRKVLHLKDRFWLILDHITGRGTHRADSFVHFHREATVAVTAPGRLSASRNGQRLTVCAFDYDEWSSFAGQTDPVQGWYSPEFGIRQPRQTFCLTKAGPAPFFMGYVLVPGEASEILVSCQIHETEQYEVCLDGTRWVVEVRPATSEMRVQEGRSC
jgi:uncharacterized heparinase superfamily protein